MAALGDLQAEVNDWVRGLFDGFSLRTAGEKVVRDPVNGFETFRPHEVALIDSPLLQRLRRIHQTALAYYVYPGADHTRFSHCLGVAHLADRMVTALNSRGAGISERDRTEVRLSGLLHDVGHGMFSHLSESIFAEQFAAEIQAISSTEPRFKSKGLGEILSYLIVTSPRFREVMSEIEVKYSVEPIDLDRVASYFLGAAKPGEPERQCLAEIISGPLDADKMDYFARDCHYTGIKAEIDVERLLISIDLDHRSTSEFRHIVVRSSGVHHLEHIIFSKMMLYSSVYHHHKIRALECSVRGVFRKIWHDPSAIKDERLRFKTLGSILSMTEDEFWTASRVEPRIGTAIAGIADSRLVLMRSVALGMPTILDDEKKKDELRRFWDIEHFPERQRQIGDTIAGMLPGGVDPGRFGVWFDVPTRPPVSSDAKRALVDTGESYVPLHQFFPSDEWVDAYNDNKLLAHVFTDPDLPTRAAVTRTAYTYFRDELGIELAPRAVLGCYKPLDGVDFGDLFGR